MKWTSLGQAVEAISQQAQPQDASLYHLIAEASMELGKLSNPVPAQGPWLALMDQATKRCKAAGAPLN